MHIAGIIAEYDPFHKGHAAHIAATRTAGATHVVAVLSGSFTQRGEPAALTKFDRAAMALAGGVDLVLELPLPWAMAPAQRFAEGGVALLQALGCVDTLSFGSECGDIAALRRLADLTFREDYATLLRQAMDAGLPYAAARQQAAHHLLGDEAALLTGPNNTLAIEYIAAATRLGAKFAFYTLQRQGALHHDTAPAAGVASATLLRQWLREGNTEQAAAYVPPAAAEILRDALAVGRAPTDAARLEGALLARLRCMTVEQLAALPYVSEGLEHRLWQAARTAPSVEEWLMAVKTRRYPLSRLRRILWAALLDLPKESVFPTPPYIRVLGMNDRGVDILAAAQPALPLFTRVSQVTAMGEEAQRLFALECRATDLHSLALPAPPPCGTDCTEKLRRL